MPIKCPKCHSENPETKQFCADCGTLLTPPRDLEVSVTRTLETTPDELTRGTLFAGRYEIIEELGTGGMGKVYRAFDKKIEEEVALKFLRQEIGADKRIVDRFRNELRTARKIRHNNICQMYDLHEDEKTLFIAMEYVRGEDLKSLIRRTEKLTVGKAISIASQIAEGLAEAHRLGVIHRDLKPGNIMIDKEGNAKIMDFGIARTLAAEGTTAEGAIIGTPEYMSPEQVEGKEADQRSDIYSLGVIIYEMVTGRAPFEGDTPFSIANKHKSEIARDPRELNPQITLDLSRLILKCLEKEKEKRYQSAEELHSELATIEQGMPTGERILPKKKVATAKKATVTFRKRRVFMASIFLTVVVAALAFFILRGVKGIKEVLPGKNKMLVVMPFENLGLPEDEYFADGMTVEITNRLSSLYGLDVISRDSAVQYKKTNRTIQQIKQELNIDYALTGTVRWDKAPGQKGRVRISPQLIRASDATQIWSGTYEQPIEDIFAVQAGIAEEAAKQLDLILLEPERKALEAKPTKNLEAYDCYLRTIDHFNKGGISGDFQELRLGIETGEEAIKLDPNFAGIYVILSDLHSWMFFSGVDRTNERLAKSKAAIDKALELEPNMPEAKELLAWYYYRGFHDYDRALEIIESVQEARPNRPSSLPGIIQKRQGKFEQSLANLKSVFKLSPRSSWLPHEIACIYMALRRYEEAETWFDRALSIDPEYVTAKLNKGTNTYLWKGVLDESRAMLKTFPPDSGADSNWTWLEITDRNYKEALDRLGTLSYTTNEWQVGCFHKDLTYADVFYALKEFSSMKSHADLARADLEKTVHEHPDDPRYHIALGRAYAYLGRKEDAIREGNQAVSILPVSKDAMDGPSYVADSALIDAIAGEHKSAIDKLDYLMSIPAGMVVSAASLRNDPTWDPLRSDPRFAALLKKYGSEK